MLTLIPTPIGNIKDITLNAIEKLQNADIFICEDTRNTKKLFHLIAEKLNIKTNYKNKKFISLHSHNEDIILNDLKNDLTTKNCVYLADAGIPCISDPGSKLVEFCMKNGITYNSLPGANAALLAYTLSGIENKEFLFYGFLPHKKNRINELKDILNLKYSVILYESTYRIKQLLNEIEEIDKDRVVFIAKELTKLNQFFVKNNISNINKLDIDFKGEWTIIILPNDKIKNEKVLTIEDVKNLSIPPKIKAKLLAKLTNNDVKTIYNSLTK